MEHEGTHQPALIFKQTSACVYTQHIRKYLTIIINYSGQNAVLVYMYNNNIIAT